MVKDQNKFKLGLVPESLAANRKKGWMKKNQRQIKQNDRPRAQKRNFEKIEQCH